MRILKQGASFFAVGLIQLAIDWFVFFLLTKSGCDSGGANVAGRVTGACFGFWLNGTWTFSDGITSRLSGAHLLRFITLWSITLLISTTVVASVSHYEGLHVAWVIKPVSDLILAGGSFLVSKYWVYR
jgi:putative flippase GtrA